MDIIVGVIAALVIFTWVFGSGKLKRLARSYSNKPELASRDAKLRRTSRADSTCA